MGTEPFPCYTGSVTKCGTCQTRQQACRHPNATRAAPTCSQNAPCRTASGNLQAPIQLHTKRTSATAKHGQQLYCLCRIRGTSRPGTQSSWKALTQAVLAVSISSPGLLCKRCYVCLAHVAPHPSASVNHVASSPHSAAQAAPHPTPVKPQRPTAHPVTTPRASLHLTPSSPITPYYHTRLIPSVPPSRCPPLLAVRRLR